MDFIRMNWLEITILAVIGIAIIVYIIWQIKKNGLRGFVVRLITKAEDIFEHGQNTKKMNYVIDIVIAKLPLPLNLFITRNTVKKFIQKVFDETKEALDYKQK